MKRKSKIKLKKVRNGYILYSLSKKGAHSHFFNRRAARKCQTFINKGILPSKPYFIESCRRLLSRKEFERLRPRKKKPRYFNVNNGVKR